MRQILSILLAAFAATNVLAHGVITEVQGANSVNMPGLSVIDGTPRDCATPGCGAEDDTSIIRDKELGTSKASALGRTKAGGPVSAAKMMAIFVGGDANSTAAVAAREVYAANVMRRNLAKRADSAGTKTPKGTKEAGVAAAAGAGLAKGLPTCSDDGVVKMTFHQVNQDGAGPLTASVDPTSGGTDPEAFQAAQMTTDVPGSKVGGLSGVTATDFDIAMQMPAGMQCKGQIGSVSDVCVAKAQNGALAGPFGGSVAFTQSPAAKKRAIEYNLRKRRFARALASSI